MIPLVAAARILLVEIGDAGVIRSRQISERHADNERIVADGDGITVVVGPDAVRQREFFDETPLIRAIQVAVEEVNSSL
jgi:hypothetical protein